MRTTDAGEGGAAPATAPRSQNDIGFDDLIADGGLPEAQDRRNTLAIVAEQIGALMLALGPGSTRQDARYVEGYNAAIDNVLALIERAAVDALREAAPAPARPQEQCICAAIRLKNGEVWRGHRHDSAILTAMRAPDVSREDIAEAEQGFITSCNRFVGRTEGAEIQRRAGIVSAENLQPVGVTLFSEDLYLRDWRSPDPPSADPARREEGSMEKDHARFDRQSLSDRREDSRSQRGDSSDV